MLLEFENIGIKIKNNTLAKFEKGLAHVKRVEVLNKIINNNRRLTEEIIGVTENIYTGIRSLYNPNLPKKSQSIIFARQQIKEKVTPWNVLETLYVSLINMKKNFEMNKDMIIAEPLYILLAAHNHPDAHEHVRELTLKAQLSRKSLKELIKKDDSLKPYLKKFTRKQLEIINNPGKYTGIASKKVEDICKFWNNKLKK